MLEDHDLLIVMNEKLDELKLQFSNHLAHHHKYTLAAWGIVLAAIIGLIFK